MLSITHQLPFVPLFSDAELLSTICEQCGCYDDEDCLTKVGNNNNDFLKFCTHCCEYDWMTKQVTHKHVREYATRKL
jgi:hypothetical protein